MSISAKVEYWLDTLFGRNVRKALEQVAHAVMAGAPAFLVVNWLPIPFAASVGLAVACAVLLGGIREYLQNVDDEPDETTLLTIARVPINADLLVDMAAYGVGGVLAGVLGGVI